MIFQRGLDPLHNRTRIIQVLIITGVFLGCPRGTKSCFLAMRDTKCRVVAKLMTESRSHEQEIAGPIPPSSRCCVVEHYCFVLVQPTKHPNIVSGIE